jgi:hypothetical protein
MDCPTIYRGTTPTITLNVHGIDFSDAVTWPVVVVSLKAGAQRIDVERGQLAIAQSDGGSTVTTQLTQAQTLGFDVMRPVAVQLRAKAVDGNAVATPIGDFIISDVLRDGEI